MEHAALTEERFLMRGLMGWLRWRAINQSKIEVSAVDMRFRSSSMYDRLASRVRGNGSTG